MHTAEEDEANTSEEDNDSNSSHSGVPRKRRLTEGNIDVDEELDSGEDDADHISEIDLEDECFAEGQDDDEDSQNAVPTDLPSSFCGPAEKAAEICRLPSRRITSDELFLFPFMEEENNVALRPAYLIARNAAVRLYHSMDDLCFITEVAFGSPYSHS